MKSKSALLRALFCCEHKFYYCKMQGFVILLIVYTSMKEVPD